MILVQSPYRVSLFGGGTDYPEWFREHGGCVLGMAIDRYCYVGLKRLPPLYDFKFRVAYQRVEDCNSVAEIQHPAVRGVLEHFKYSGKGLELHHAGDLPARAGLGASSSFVVGLVHAMHALELDMFVSPVALAREATHVERNVIGETVGYQDQVFAAHGGFLFLEFNHDDTVTVRSVALPGKRREELEASLVLVYTGTMRDAHVMAAQQIKEIKKNGLRLRLAELADLAREAFYTTLKVPGVSLSQVGYRLNDAWQIKRRLCEGITDSNIDALYEHGLRCGALGGKLLGAGGGGFMLFFVPPEHRTQFEEKIGATCVGCKISDTGSRILLNQP